MSDLAKDDKGKPIFTLVPPEIIRSIERVRNYGNRKYPNGGPNNWRNVEPQRYWEAVLRHTLASWNDYTAKDPESGLLHLEHIATNIAFLLQFIKEDADRIEREVRREHD